MTEIINEIKSNINFFAKEGDSTVYRVFHGRGGLFPGLTDLNIERYGSLLFAVIYTARKEPFIEQLCRILLDEFKFVERVTVQQRHTVPASIVAEASRNTTGTAEINCSFDGTLSGRMSCDVKPEVVKEMGLSFKLLNDLSQNSGFFTDTYEVRKFVRNNSKEAKVLNLFAYTCAFSVAAVAGGAESVVNVDMNRNLLTHGRENHRLNNHDLRKVSFLPYRIMRSLSRLKKFGPYDLIISDPPSAQKGSFHLQTEYRKLYRSCAGMLNVGGLFLVCCNSPFLTPDEVLSLLDPESCNTKLEFVQQLPQCHSYKEKNPDYGIKVFVFRKENTDEEVKNEDS